LENSVGIRAGVLLCACLALAGSRGWEPCSRGLGQSQQAAPPAQGITPASGIFPSFALRGTAPLKLPLPSNLLDQQRDQIAQCFVNQIAASPAGRDKLWKPNFSSLTTYGASLQGHRHDLRKMLGLIPASVGSPEIKLLQGAGPVHIEDIRLPIAEGFEAEAILFLPQTGSPKPAVIAVPPATESAEEFAGIAQQMELADWLKVLLARNVAVAIPILEERTSDHPLCQEAGGKDRRRILWQAGFIAGRTLVGIDVQQVLAVQRFLASQRDIDSQRIGILGERQGGMTALYAAATDEQFAGVGIVDYFQQRENCWKEPVDRLLYGQLKEFGDAELTALIAPRPLFIVTSAGGPVRFVSEEAESQRAALFYRGLRESDKLISLKVQDGGLEIAALKLSAFLGAEHAGSVPNITLQIPSKEIKKRRDEHFVMLYRYVRGLDAASDQRRTDYWQLDSTPAEDLTKRSAQIRSELSHLIGAIPTAGVPLNPRTALVGETKNFLAYDVLLSVVPGVDAYGQLLVPRSAAGDVEKRLPAIVCQHGFNGAPKYVTGAGSAIEVQDRYYHRFGERLAERGYVVFAPYMVATDSINPIVRMAASVGMMRTSIELAKLHRVVDFLQSLPFVDPDRIGYYGMSYGGYAAAWMVPLEPRLRFTIISAYFSVLRLELTGTSPPGHSFWNQPDEDPFTWNTLNRFSDLELIAAMYPRPVCIEWGLNDGSTTPSWHRQAWKEVEAYSDAWNVSDRIEDDDFIGAHTVHGIQTFLFIDRWLRPERSAGRDYGCEGHGYCARNLAPDLHGYSLNSLQTVPYVTERLDSDQTSTIRGRLYVSDVSPVFTGMLFKLSRVGSPGNVIVRFGSAPGESNIGQTEILATDVYPGYDLWYAAKLRRPAKLNSRKLYYFELTAESGRAPQNYYLVYGPKPLGGTDYPGSFGLSFRVQTQDLK
jgi:dienelactone hydrolase